MNLNTKVFAHDKVAKIFINLYRKDKDMTYPLSPKAIYPNLYNYFYSIMEKTDRSDLGQFERLVARQETRFEMTIEMLRDSLNFDPSYCIKVTQNFVKAMLDFLKRDEEGLEHCSWSAREDLCFAMFHGFIREIRDVWKEAKKEFDSEEEF